MPNTTTPPLSDQTAKTLTAPPKIGGDVDMLVAGKDAKAAADAAAKLDGVRKVLLAESDTLAERLAEPLAATVVSLAGDYDTLIAPATTMGKNVMPRVAALARRDAGLRHHRGRYPPTRSSARPMPATPSRPCSRPTPRRSSPCAPPPSRRPVKAARPPSRPSTPPPIRALSSFVENRIAESDRPELTSAKIIISGGRALGSSEKFQEVILPVADKLGAAVGASRAAVDAGYAPNDWQVGQTGKVVAPDLYIACGISGAIQHLAGMKDSKVIVAINKDEEAPIFQVADYGLVADLFEALPEARKGALTWPERSPVLVVVDLTQMLAGPYCTMMLADQGARVIKIEPIEGDPTRTFRTLSRRRHRAPFRRLFPVAPTATSSALAIDLKQEEGKALLKRLVSGADILVENFRAGVMDRLGISYETLAAANPRLVYAAIRGFGDPRTGASPYADRPAFDVVAQAMGGAMGITGPDPQTPIKIGPGIGDIFPASLASFGILSAYVHALRTGQGQFVDVAMYDGIVSLCERIIYQYSYTGRSPKPEGNQHPILCPFGTFAARDGQVTIGCPRDSFWLELATVMDRPDLAADERLRTNNGRLAHREEVVEAVEDWTHRRSKAEIAEALGLKVPFGPVNTAADIYADPHMAARQMLVEVEHPGAPNPVTIASTPIRMSLTQGGVTRRAPLAGEDTDSVLAELGLSSAEIESLRSRRIVG